MAASNQELEVKLYLENLDQVQQTLESLGANLVQARTYERNLRFDTVEGKLTQNKEVLRLRQDRSNQLTYKGAGKVIDGVSARTEIEFSVDRFDQAQALFEALGYQVSMIYEKFRTAYDLNGTLVTLDEMPFGNFAEIEGIDGESIQNACQQLNLNWEMRTPQSYAELFETVKDHLKLRFRDLTFENFAKIKVQASDLGMAPADLR
jgi:adenylate cyclase class 2